VVETGADRERRPFEVAPLVRDRKGGAVKRAIIVAFLATLTLGVVATSAPAQPSNFRALLSGAGEVPARDTLARGVAIFQLNADGTELGFRLVVANIENVFAAHIHCGAVGVNGPVGVTLFGGVPGGGRTNGVLAEGTITAPDAGNGCGWADIASVAAAIESGAAYVNVHTNDGIDPANTGPGDFPGGEIRDQVF
jgi:CHRD domain